MSTMSCAREVYPKYTLLLDLPPACLQFSPLNPDHLVVGTYHLQQGDLECGDDRPGEPAVQQSTKTAQPQIRNGSLVVLSVQRDTVSQVQTLPHPSAILDLHFHPGDDELQKILAVVSSTGTLAIFRFDPCLSRTTPLDHRATTRCEDLAENGLFLQFKWHPSRKRVIAVTTSLGGARLLTLDDEWKIKSSTDLPVRNSLEAWSIAFSPQKQLSNPGSESCMIYCGGDDCNLRYTLLSWNDRSETSKPILPSSTITVKNQHDAGVTAILPLPIHAANGGRIVLTGSYDDVFRVLLIHDQDDAQGAKRATLAAQANLGGGVWRLELVHASADSTRPAHARILASCMHAGPRLVEIVSPDGNAWACRILARCEAHASMNYAASCVTDGPGGEVMRCVSTSFYDKLLCLWECDEASLTYC